MRTRAAADFAALLAAYLEELQRCHYSPTTQRQVREQLPYFFESLRRQRVRDIRSVTEAHLVAYLRHLKEGKRKRGGSRSQWTVVSYFQVVKRFFAFLEQRSVILRNPARAVRIPRVQALPRTVLTEAEARRLMAAPSAWTILGKRDRALLELFYGAGLRLRECTRLDLGDVDLNRHTALVRDGKGRKDRVVPIAGRAIVALTTYLREARPELIHDSREAALFLASTGRRIAAITVQKLVPQYAKAAGISRTVSAHALRHSCATHLLQGGADVRYIQELLGHQVVNTTMIYTRVNMSDLKKAFDRAHPRERRGRKMRR